MVSSEFGRTPKINKDAGRDHWPKVFSVVLAGGGIKKGFIYGTSNATASEPEHDPLGRRGPGDDRLPPARHRRRQGADGPRRPADRDRRRRQGAQGTAGLRRSAEPCRGTSARSRRGRHAGGRWADAPPPTGTPTPPELRDVLPRSPLDDVPTHATDVIDSLVAAFGLDGRPRPDDPGRGRAELRAASPSLDGDPAARRPARDRGRAHLHRRPARRRPGDPLLSAGDHRRRSSSVVNDDQVKATVKIAPDCRLGLHDLRLRTATGISELRTFSVGALRTSPRTSRTTTSPSRSRSRMNVTVNGVADNEDVDYYAVEAKKGERITAEVEASGSASRSSTRTSRSWTPSGSSWPPATTPPWSGRTAFASVDRPRGRHVHHPGPRERLRRQRHLPLPAPRRQLPPADRRRSPAAASSARRSSVRWIGDVAGEKTTEGDAAREPRARLRPRRPGRRGASPPIRTRSGSRPSATSIEAEPNDDQATATPFTAPAGAQRGDREAGRRRSLRLHGQEGADLRRPRLRPLASLAARLGPLRRQAGRRGARRQRRQRRPRQLLPLRRPGGRRVRRSGSTTSSARAGPTTSTGSRSARSSRRLTLSVPNESLVRGTGTIAVAVPQGEPAGDPGQRQPRRLRRRPRPSAPRACPPGVTFEADPMAANLATYPGPVHRQGRRARRPARWRPSPASRSTPS